MQECHAVREGCKLQYFAHRSRQGIGEVGLSQGQIDAATQRGPGQAGRGGLYRRQALRQGGVISDDLVFGMDHLGSEMALAQFTQNA